MTLTKLQSNLYKELWQRLDVQAFNKGYAEIIKNLPKAQQAFYSREFVFLQGYVYGTPANLPHDTLKNIIAKAGYKDTESDRTYNSYYKVLEKLYKLV